MRYLNPSLVATLLAGLVLLGGAPRPDILAAQQRVSVFPSPIPPPPTFAEFKAAADLIVRGRVVRVSEPAIERLANNRPALRRWQHVTVTEVISGDARFAGRQIQVLQGGGTARVDGVEMSVAYTMRLFEPGDDFVLFLDQMRPNHFSIVFAKHGALKVDGSGFVAIPDEFTRYSEFKDVDRLSVPAFIAYIRDSTTLHAATCNH